MSPRPEKCIGNCGRDIAVGQTIFQVYVGGYWSTPYITPDRHQFLGNWCVDCFQRDHGHLIGSQEQPYECTLCGGGFQEHELVIYATCGTRPGPPALRAEKRGSELHFIVGEECWTDDRFAKLHKIFHETYLLQSSSTELERPLILKRLAYADPMVGRKVRHPTFGLGTVVDVEGFGDDRRISVRFPGRGTKKLIERYAQLQQV
jgi:hypothetical protein